MRAESLHPPAWPSKTAGLKRMPFRWLVAVWWNVLWGVSFNPSVSGRAPCGPHTLAGGSRPMGVPAGLALCGGGLLLATTLSAVLGSCAWTDSCVVAEAVEDLAVQWSSACLVEEPDAKAVLWSHSDDDTARGAWWSSREIGPLLSGPRHQGVKCASHTRVKKAWLWNGPPGSHVASSWMVA